MKEYVDLFVNYLLHNPLSEDEEILLFLVHNNVPENIANDLVAYTPISFCRMYFRNSGVRFFGHYFIKKNTETTQREFIDCKVFVASNEYYLKYIENHLTKESLINIIGRSSDYDAIIQALEENSELKNLIVYPMTFYYSD